MPKQKNIDSDANHIPVLLKEVLTYLSPKAGQSYLDLTAGMGGHAAAVLSRTEAPQKAVLIDRDPVAAAVVAKRLPDSDVRQQDFLSASQQLLEEGRQFDLILADLGVSSLHLDDPARGFSFARSGPLDMRMDPSQELTAEIIVNQWSQEDLENLLRDFGEEPRAARIVQAIIAGRPIADTVQLASIVAKAYPQYSRRHPATRAFQALRLAVNSELAQLEQSLPLWVQLLAPNGRLAVISFHSLEDRLVKKAFSERAIGYEAEVQILTKHPVVASPQEVVFNPRARSAKLRAVAKIKK